MLRRQLFQYSARLCAYCLLTFTGLEAQLAPITAPAELTLAQAEEMLLQRNLTLLGNRQQVEVNLALRQIAEIGRAHV